MDSEFRQYVDKLYLEQKGTRVYRFEYKGKGFWLKQPEVLDWWMHFLKPHPQKAFFSELEVLTQLFSQGVSVPEVVYSTSEFFVLEDSGRTITQWVDDHSTSSSQKFMLLSEASLALIELHRKGLVHGRPAVRDITWQNEKITFLDFESRSKSQNQTWLVVRDMFFFFNSLCREENISDELIKETVLYYQAHCNSANWDALMMYLRRFRWVYYLLLPFKPVAKKDLIAIYRLFNLLLIKEK